MIRKLNLDTLVQKHIEHVNSPILDEIPSSYELLLALMKDPLGKKLIRRFSDPLFGSPIEIRRYNTPSEDEKEYLDEWENFLEIIEGDYSSYNDFRKHARCEHFETEVSNEQYSQKDYPELNIQPTGIFLTKMFSHYKLMDIEYVLNNHFIPLFFLNNQS